MERRTRTTLDQLRIGDIFHFLQSEEKFQVTEQTRTHAHINKPDYNRGRVSIHDQVVRNEKWVIFLRHTRPEPGEKCIVQDLRPGEVFHTLTDVITEYVMDISGKIVKTDGQDAPLMKKEDTVVFVRTQL